MPVRVCLAAICIPDIAACKASIHFPRCQARVAGTADFPPEPRAQIRQMPDVPGVATYNALNKQQKN
jgi:hypothetical protein